MSRARIVHWMLEEIGVPYTTKLLRFEHKRPECLALNPMGKLPTIQPGSPERGTYYRWLFLGAGCVEPATLDRAFTRNAQDDKSMQELQAGA